MTTPSEEEARAAGFAAREAMARKAWEFYTTREVAMTHDFRGGYHQGFIDGAASRVSTPPSEDWEYAVRWVETEGKPITDIGADPEDVAALVVEQDGWAAGVRRRIGSWEPVPAVPVLPTEPEEKR